VLEQQKGLDYISNACGAWVDLGFHPHDFFVLPMLFSVLGNVNVFGPSLIFMFQPWYIKSTDQPALHKQPHNNSFRDRQRHNFGEIEFDR
jgi:hypothetical protein